MSIHSNLQVGLLLEGKTDAIDQSQFIQNETILKSAPKIFKETCQIDFEKSVDEVYNFVRGLSPHPTAWAEVELPGLSEKIMLKVFEAEKEIISHDFSFGHVVTDGKKASKIAVKDGFIHLKSVQTPGKKRMDIGELIRGMRF